MTVNNYTEDFPNLDLSRSEVIGLKFEVGKYVSMRLFKRTSEDLVDEIDISWNEVAYSNISLNAYQFIPSITVNKCHADSELLTRLRVNEHLAKDDRPYYHFELRLGDNRLEIVSKSYRVDLLKSIPRGSYGQK